jgi:hypothetical protein
MVATGQDHFEHEDCALGGCSPRVTTNMFGDAVQNGMIIPARRLPGAPKAIEDEVGQR